MSDNKIKETLKKDRLHFQNKIQILYLHNSEMYTILILLLYVRYTTFSL